MPILKHSLPLAVAALVAMPAALRAEQPALQAASGVKVEPLTPKAAKASRDVVVDPMQELRQRLAAKLGAAKAADAGSEQAMRISTRPDGGVRPGQADAPRAAAPAATTPKTGAQHRGGHWSYDGASGPQAWARLKPEFAKCGSGSRQSPIDIRDGIRVDLDPVRFDYQPSAFSVLDNGHTVQVNVAPGNSIEVMGRRFELMQFHFHRPSEERIDGRAFDMVVHLVHKGADGRLAVVAVLLERGSAQPQVQAVWNNLPLECGDEVSASAAIDLAGLLPEDRRYFVYMGSLTTPPCSEGVLWMVMQQPVGISAQQIDIFARLYPMNARPIQQASGRLIKQSN